MKTTVFDKICTLDQIEKKVSQFKKQGQKVVLCHGVFDLLHSGHILHFKAAKAHGDILVVSVTPDQHVTKGPDRPFFNENLRLQNVAEIETVDYVVLNQWITAIETIYKIKPNFYAKGIDYSESKKDITANIQREEAAINEIGGSIVFTDEQTLSSSRLLNEFFSTYSHDARVYLKKFKEEHTAEDVFRHIDNLTHLNVLLIGESILDHYTYCLPLAKATKDPIISTKFVDEEFFLGGTLAIANHVSNLCKKVTLLTQMGNETKLNKFIKKHLNNNVN